MPTIRPLALAVVAVLTFAACGGGDSTPASNTATSAADGAAGDSAAGASVAIKVFNFQPDPLEIKVGETVKWTNEDDILHTVTSGTREKPDGAFDGQLAAKGDTFERTFDKAGTYDYFCSRHPGEGMTAQVVVS